jgi:hypothetical protein
VLNEAAEEAARFQAMVSGDFTGSEVPAGEAEVSGDARYAEGTRPQTTLEELEDRVAALEAWKTEIDSLMVAYK